MSSVGSGAVRNKGGRVKGQFRGGESREAPPQNAQFSFTCQSLCPQPGQSHWGGSQQSGRGPGEGEKGRAQSWGHPSIWPFPCLRANSQAGTEALPPLCCSPGIHCLRHTGNHSAFLNKPAWAEHIPPVTADSGSSFTPVLNSHSCTHRR